MKEDLYSNAKVMMEQVNIDIISDMKLLDSIHRMHLEYTVYIKLKISLVVKYCPMSLVSNASADSGLY